MTHRAENLIGSGCAARSFAMARKNKDKAKESTKPPKKRER
jgi:hypothetical protein